MVSPKLQIYKGIIQYLLYTTNYNLQDIADVTGTSIKNIKAIYFDEYLPRHFPSESKLIKIYQLLIEFRMNLENKPQDQTIY